MFKKTIQYFIYSALIIISNISLANETNLSIRQGMPLEKFSSLNCRGMILISTEDIKHKIPDSRLRKFCRYKPPLSAVMKESDLRSYFELVFDAGKLAEINQYDEKGKFLERHNELYCF